jgi:class 3 adenylate cyclase
VRVDHGRVFVAFDGPARAIRLRLRHRRPCPSNRSWSLRIGLHTGECDMVSGVPHGAVVDISCRVAALAKTDEVLVSRTVVDLVAGSGLKFTDRGTHALSKGQKGWRVYAARAEQ